MDFTIIDIETTGLSAYYHHITEIAALKYKKGRVVDEFCTLVNPGVKIPAFITRLTGIDDEMVNGKPKISKVIPQFNKFLGKSVFVAHNAGFDYKFLDEALRNHVGSNLENPKLCTCKLARRLLPELPSKRLSSLCEHFGINNNQAHRARSDAFSTLKIFDNFINMLKEKEIHDVDEILKFQKSKIPKTF